MIGALSFLGYLVVLAVCVIVAAIIVTVVAFSITALIMAIPAFARWIWTLAETRAEKQAEDESVEGHVGNLDVFVPLSEDVAAVEAGLPKMGSAE